MFTWNAKHKWRKSVGAFECGKMKSGFTLKKENQISVPAKTTKNHCDIYYDSCWVSEANPHIILQSIQETVIITVSICYILCE